jgi:hypothetical protein
MKPYLSTLPLRRLGRRDELAHAVLFLMTNGYTTEPCSMSTAGRC